MFTPTRFARHTPATYFGFAPKTEATAAPAAEKPAASEHWLLKGGRKVIFRANGDTVNVRTFAGPWCDKDETLTLEAARAKYRTLIGFGWEKW